MEETPNYSNNNKYEMYSSDGTLVGEILWENERGEPAFIFKGRPSVSFQVESSITGEVLEVMYTDDDAYQGLPVVKFIVAEAQSFVANAIETSNFVFPST